VVVFGAPPAFPALRARRAAESSCDASLGAMSPGRWVRLRGCGVDMFHAGFLDDGKGTRTHRVTPLRSPWGFAAEPGALGLAIPMALAGDTTTFSTTPRTDSAYSKTADLGETIGVVWGPAGARGHTLAEVAGFSHGLEPNALLIEMRQVPPLRPAAMLAGGGAVALLLAVATFLYRPREREERPLLESAPHRDVRWGLVFTGLLVGVVALWGGLGWYFDPMRESRARVTTPAATRAPATPPRIPAATQAPPTEAELALLRSPDPANQRTGVDTLLARAITPEVVTAVEAALASRQAPDVEARLVCLKARFEGPNTVDFLLARFPRDRKQLAWNLDPGVSCVLDALVAHAAESPERIRDALLPAIYSGNGGTREKALTAFRRMDLPEIPAMLRAEAATPGPYRREALLAALALGALTHNPELVESAFKDSETRSAVVHTLRTDPRAVAARIVARGWVENSYDSTIERLAIDRDRQMNDVSAALVEVVGSEASADRARVTAARQLATLGEVGALSPLRHLALTLPPGELKTTVEATIGALDGRVAKGQRARMRELPPETR
jgi:hypothetical protein